MRNSLRCLLHSSPFFLLPIAPLSSPSPSCWLPPGFPFFYTFFSLSLSLSRNNHHTISILAGTSRKTYRVRKVLRVACFRAYQLSPINSSLTESCLGEDLTNQELYKIRLVTHRTNEFVGFQQNDCSYRPRRCSPSIHMHNYTTNIFCS